MAKISSLWDISKGLPDQRAFNCDARGKANPNGRYLAWPTDKAAKTTPETVYSVVPGGMLSAAHCYITKIHIKYVREAMFDYKKFVTLPVDLTDKKNKRRIQRKISRILQNLGVAYADRAGLLQASNDVATSAWITDKNGKEAIAINPWILLQNNMSTLVRLVKKEVVHRALYKNLGELSNKKILNFALDVLSMRVVSQTAAGKLDKQTVRLAERLFDPKVYKKFPLLALCDPSLTSDQVKNNLPHAISDIWHSLYGKSQYSLLPSLSTVKPSALYFQIKALSDKIFGTEANYPWNVEPSKDNKDGSIANDDQASAQFDKKNDALNNGVRDNMLPRKYRGKKGRRGGGYSNALSRFWEEQVVRKKDFVNEELKKFAKKWRTEKMLEDIEGKIEQIIGKDEVQIKPYAEELTYDGLIMASFGISQEMGIYWNNDDSFDNNRKKVAAFFDLSPSMTNLFPYMIRLVETVEEQCDVVFSRNLSKEEGGGTARGAYGFAGSVTELDENDMEKMKKGNLKAGMSTCFNAILEHVFERIESDNIDIIICFTDGESSLSKDNIQKFNDTGRQFFNIYMKPYYGGEASGLKITSDLDELNGESFTLCLPPVDGAMR